ncbi:MAG: pyridoxal phosphate-dependent aminotransferase [Anaerolineales bacterium]|nr:pyridoxal phosphate-dependent aminotransferase [Anaerolineales bacterium]
MEYNFDSLIDRRSTNSVKWSRYPQDVLPMWVADMDFPAPEPILRALRQAVDHGVFGYDWPREPLYKTVAVRMEKLYGWQIEPEMVVAVPGLVSGFNVAAGAVCDAGTGILMQPPVYFPFLSVHENQQLVRQLAPLKKHSRGDSLRYEIDWEIFEGAVHSNGARTRMCLLCQPHNPTGQIYSQSDLLCIAEKCRQEEIIICSDEIHNELLLGSVDYAPLASHSPGIAAYTITLVAPSKTFNIAGLFCGFAIIPDRELRKKFEKQMHCMTLHVNGLGLIAAQAAMSGECDDWLDELRIYLTANRDFAVQFIHDKLPGIRTTLPDATYLLWLDCSELVRAGQIEGSPHLFFLEKARVALNDGADFGPGGEDFVRLNFGCPRATLAEALNRMEKILN